jgi:hypothetical protein
MSSIALPVHLADLAAGQYGVLAATQLRSASFSRLQIRHRVDEGLLRPWIGDTFLVAGAPPTPMARYRGATLNFDGGVLAGRAAADLLVFPKARPTKPVVMVPLPGGHAIAGIDVKRRDDLLDRHRSTFRGIPCTTIPRTVLDLAAGLSVGALGDLVDDLVGFGRVTLTDLFDELDLIARRGRNGTTAMRLVLEPRLADQLIPASKLHRRGLAFLRRYGFPTPDTEFKPPWAGPEVGRVDNAYPHLKVVIEWDGRTWHDRSDRFENDRLRDQLAMSHHWIVVRITWRQLHGDTAGLAQRLRNTLDGRSLREL